MDKIIIERFQPITGIDELIKEKLLIINLPANLIVKLQINMSGKN